MAAPRPELGRREGDPVVALACILFQTAASSSGDVQGARALVGAEGTEDSGAGDGGGEGEEGEEAAPGEAAPAQPPAVVDAIRPGRSAAAACAPGSQACVFLLAPAMVAAGCKEAAERSMAPAGSRGAARLLCFASEEELLLCWAETVRAVDPDVLACFQVGARPRQRGCSLMRADRTVPALARLATWRLPSNQPADLCLESFRPPGHVQRMPWTCPPAALQVKDTLAVLQERFAALGLEPLKVRRLCGLHFPTFTGASVAAFLASGLCPAAQRVVR